jgi:predicted DNA binding protein
MICQYIEKQLSDDSNLPPLTDKQRAVISVARRT